MKLPVQSLACEEERKGYLKGRLKHGAFYTVWILYLGLRGGFSHARFSCVHGRHSVSLGFVVVRQTAASHAHHTESYVPR